MNLDKPNGTNKGKEKSIQMIQKENGEREKNIWLDNVLIFEIEWNISQWEMAECENCV